MIDSAAPAAEPPYLPGMEPDTSQQQFTYRDVANLKRVSVQTVMEWVKLGKVPSPIYTGATARFTPEAVHQILMGMMPAGTYTPAESLRAEVGAKGGQRAKKKAAVKKKATAKKPAAKMPASKKPAAKMPAAKKNVARRKAGAA